jgi:hypothetical protein
MRYEAARIIQTLDATRTRLFLRITAQSNEIIAGIRIMYSFCVGVDPIHNDCAEKSNQTIKRLRIIMIYCM